MTVYALIHVSAIVRVHVMKHATRHATQTVTVFAARHVLLPAQVVTAHAVQHVNKIAQGVLAAQQLAPLVVVQRVRQVATEGARQDVVIAAALTAQIIVRGTARLVARIIV